MCYEDTFYFTFYLRRLGWDTDDTSLLSSHKTWLTDKTKALFLFIVYASRPGLGRALDRHFFFKHSAAGRSIFVRDSIDRGRKMSSSKVITS
jgi:hypothetical protein